MSDLNSLWSVSLNRSVSFHPLIQRLKETAIECWGWTPALLEGLLSPWFAFAAFLFILISPCSVLAHALASAGRYKAGGRSPLLHLGRDEEVGCHLFHFKMSCAGFHRELWILELTWTSV